MAERAFGDAALPEDERNAATLTRWLQHERPSLVNARDIRRKAKLPGMRESKKVRAALEIMEEANIVRYAPHRAGETPGRYRDDFEVNPLLWGAAT
tara:strand:+ start:196 stop:483 length:288 start_codon:yes stop_codon:yes gene_type:complete